MIAKALRDATDQKVHQPIGKSTKQRRIAHSRSKVNGDVIEDTEELVRRLEGASCWSPMQLNQKTISSPMPSSPYQAKSHP
ncbi:hypothetical protein NDU88_001933 [Pleurodeles waltl]|uniref:Uncharacterized protein n=1 Tax=Pleurodeles waltl TaxID=8319 RepID=A0AAV7UW43_PLEWA|nr:hypothetical protein NDU88_001933 [Pleurodeles waltl]